MKKLTSQELSQKPIHTRIVPESLRKEERQLGGEKAIALPYIAHKT